MTVLDQLYGFFSMTSARPQPRLLGESTAALYDRSSASWTRTDPVLLSDYTARPFLVDWCTPLKGQDVLDLGCGEGYVARQLKRRGARRVEGLDISEAMIDAAAAREQNEQLGIRFRAGDAVDLGWFEDRSFDLVAAVFLFNYLDRLQTQRTMREVYRVLRPGGRFVFAVPHPSLPFLRPQEPPFYFDHGDAGYFSGRNQQFEGRIWRRDGDSVPVRCVHKTFTDYFQALGSSGFSSLPEVEELHVSEEHTALDPAFFEPLLDQPLHVAFRIAK